MRDHYIPKHTDTRSAMSHWTMTSITDEGPLGPPAQILSIPHTAAAVYYYDTRSSELEAQVGITMP